MNTPPPSVAHTHCFSLFVSVVSCLFVPHFQLSEELKQHLNQTMTDNYAQPGREAITLAVDRLQQDVRTVFTKASEALFGLCKITCCTFRQLAWSSVVALCHGFSLNDSTIQEVVLNYAEIQ